MSFKSLIGYAFCLISSNGIAQHPTSQTEEFVLSQASVSELTLVSKIDALLSALTQEGLSGSVLIAKHGQVMLSKGYGLANRKQHQNSHPETAFDIGSIAKTFTAAAIIKLQEQGKLNVDDLLSKHLDNVPEDKGSLTILNLLTHSSGLENHHARNDFQRMRRRTAVQKSLAKDLLFEPGEDWEYSNAGYALLAAIIEVVSQLPVQDYIRHNLLQPLELNSTGWFGETPDDLTFAKGYRGRRMTGSPPEWRLTWALIGGGGMFSTSTDLFTWQRAVFESQFFNAESKQLMRKAAYTRWTAGWDSRATDAGLNVIEKGGSGNYGFTSLLRLYLDSGHVLILVFNSYHDEAENETHYFVSKQIESILFAEES